MKFISKEDTRRAPKKALIVDDILDDLDFNKTRLEKAGYETVCCHISTDAFSAETELNIKADCREEIELKFKQALQDKTIPDFDILVSDGQIYSSWETDETVTGEDIINWVREARGADIKTVISTGQINTKYGEIEELIRDAKADYPSADAIVGKWNAPDNLAEVVNGLFSGKGRGAG